MACHLRKGVVEEGDQLIEGAALLHQLQPRVRLGQSSSMCGPLASGVGGASAATDEEPASLCLKAMGRSGAVASLGLPLLQGKVP